MTRQSKNDVLARTSFLYGGNAAYIEDMYDRYQSNPGDVPSGWRSFFQELKDNQPEVTHEAHGPSWKRRDWPPVANGELISALDGDWREVETQLGNKISGAAQVRGVELTQEQMRAATLDSVRALMLIRIFRVRGHLEADLDPLQLDRKLPHPELQPETYGFLPDQWDRPIFLDHVLGLEFATMAEIYEILHRTYCAKIGVEFMHISHPEEKSWIQRRMEGPDKEIRFTDRGKRAILAKLVEAEGFEKYLGLKYRGTKRFGLDGGEAMVPALEQIIKRGGHLGLKEMVIGMPHRGRLNVLGNVMDKPFVAIFNEFLGGSANPEDSNLSGDVKYHLGASADRVFDGNTVHLSLTANPSHLEIVDPVVLGKVRAKQEQRGDRKHREVMPVLLHGDAAFAGQGVVPECFALTGLQGHRTGGAIHFIVNNQIGFTTSPRFSRSSPYPSDIAKGAQTPILHVNGDDPEAVVHCAKVAAEYRQKFRKPIVIDMFCYRRFGHNEGDDPAFTQPLMYQKINEHPTVVDIYGQRLARDGVISAGELEDMKTAFRNHLDRQMEAANSYRPTKADALDGKWQGLTLEGDHESWGETGVDLDMLRNLGDRLTDIPEDFNAHRTIQRIMKARKTAILTGEGLDWATGEMLAYGSLVNEGFKVRLVGQDSERGTFSQRHSVLTDQIDERRYTPLLHVREGQGDFEVVNSMLSEEAVLGFEYGYSLAEPNALAIWEAQFGDFANGAQVVVDQFISGGEQKWHRMSGLVMLLPHGYEGQGPEHSSARPERYLQMCAENNMQVANCTTPANFFHLLRRQLHRGYRKPLIVMTPKSLLRHKMAVSKLEDFAAGQNFHRILWDGLQVAEKPDVPLQADDKIRRVVLCTGKVYYDLFAEREARGIDNVYLMRVEQLYPFPVRAVMKELGRFPKAELMWCQEEPQNMGAWFFIRERLEWVLARLGSKQVSPLYAGRAAAAATATGQLSKHIKQQNELVDSALTLDRD
ncbi:MAG: 2-oxoglutarate dehydrogenase E1 component [Hyphomicrobiales bacterium]|nr:MAG: 2-oxoglutarate dehydrogenase E1 component [Hyphomicrobiales bacterium]